MSAAYAALGFLVGFSLCVYILRQEVRRLDAEVAELEATIEQLTRRE